MTKTQTTEFDNELKALSMGLSVGHTCPTINFMLISIFELS